MKNQNYAWIALVACVFVSGGCSPSKNGQAVDAGELAEGWQYDTKTDDFEGITKSNASQWYPIEDTQIYVSFECEINRNENTQSLTLVIQNILLEDASAEVPTTEPYLKTFSSVRVKFDDDAPIEVGSQENFEPAPEQIRIDPANQLDLERLAKASAMSIRLSDQQRYSPANYEHTLKANLKNRGIQNVFTDCKRYFGQRETE